MGGGIFPIYYNITIGGEGSSVTPNLYYVINGRPLNTRGVNFHPLIFIGIGVFVGWGGVGADLPPLGEIGLNLIILALILPNDSKYES